MSESGSGTAPSTHARMSAEMAFGRPDLTPNSEGRIVLDPSGHLVAYQVHTPPESSAAGGARFLASGVPKTVLGERVHIAGVCRDDAVAVGPEGARSWHPSWSPDGDMLAFYCDAPGFPQLWVFDVAQRSSRPVGDARIKAKLWIGDEPQWFPDGSEIVVPVALETSIPAHVPAGPDATAPTVQVHSSRGRDTVDAAGESAELIAHVLRENNAAIGAVSLADGSLRTLVPADATPPPSVAQVSPSGRWVSYLSVFMPDQSGDTPSPDSFHDLAVLPAAGGTPRVIARHVSKSAFPPGTNLDTYIWHPDRNQLFWIDQGRLWTLEIGEKRQTARRLAPELDELTISPLLLTRDRQAVIVGTDPTRAAHGDSNSKPGRLALVPLDGDPYQTLPLPEDTVFQRVVAQGFATAWQPRPGAITVLVQQPATTERALLRVHTSTGEITWLWRGVAQFTPAAAPADHSFLVAAYQDYAHPTDLHVLDPDGRFTRQATRVEPELTGLDLGAVTTFVTRVPQYDGSFTDATTAVLLPPGARQGDQLPGIMFCYPGGRVWQAAAEFGGGMPSTLPLLPFLDRGYAVLLAEAPVGPDDEPGNPLDEIAAAVVPQLYRAADLGYVDLERVALAGHSYGGYGAAATIAATTCFHAAIAIDGLYDLAGDYGWLHDGRLTSMFWYFETGQARMGTHPWADPQRYHANSPYQQAHRIRTPLLLIHGADDEVCPAADAGKMYNALKRLGQDVELAIYDSEGHVPYEWSRKNAVDALQRSLDFLDRRLIESAGS